MSPIYYGYLYNLSLISFSDCNGKWTKWRWNYIFFACSIPTFKIYVSAEFWILLRSKRIQMWVFMRKILVYSNNLSLKTQIFFSLHALRRRTPSGVFICFWNSNFRTSRIGKSDRRIAIFRLSLTIRNLENYRQRILAQCLKLFPNDIFYYLNCSFFFLLLVDRSAITYYL